jgi:hypothetical protein
MLYDKDVKNIMFDEKNIIIIVKLVYVNHEQSRIENAEMH